MKIERSSIVKAPVVTICLPNLNTRAFLQERLDSILAQTFTDWELIIVDDYSTDGAWELFQRYAAADARIQLFRGPRQGLYPGWNAAIEKAAGRYVYIATSDDTMSPDCLQVLVNVLEKHPTVGVAQCGLQIIDDKSLPLPPAQQWENYTLGTFDRRLVTQNNIRRAPYGGLLHPVLFTICTSVTQLLVRASVYERVGLFKAGWGSYGDFEWQMRVGLCEDCIFDPRKLATWRIHSAQATSGVHSVHTRQQMIDMARCAFARASELCPSRLGQIRLSEFTDVLEMDMVELSIRAVAGRAAAAQVLAKHFILRPRVARKWLYRRMKRQNWDFWNCSSRNEMLNKLLLKYNIPAPEFI